MSTKKKVTTPAGKKRVFAVKNIKTDTGSSIGAKVIVGLANPITLAANKLKAFLECIQGVSAQFNYDAATLYVYTADSDTADALQFLLKKKFEFGALTLKVRLFCTDGDTLEELDAPSWTVTQDALFNMFKKLFGSSAVFRTCVDQYSTKWYFIEMNNRAISYQADNLTHLAGYESMLLADIVTWAFNTNGFQVSTYVPNVL